MEGISSDKDSVESATKASSSAAGTAQDRKAFLQKFADSEILKENLTKFFEDLSERKVSPNFDAPCEKIDLQKFDYALENVQFRQLVRMPSAIYESTSTTTKANAFLALEDFLHASASSLWEAFWGDENGVLPFYVSSLYTRNLRFYQAEKIIAMGKTGRLFASAIMLKNPRHPHGKWDDILELALLRPGVGDDDSNPPSSIISEALFFALRVLLARSISRSNFSLSVNSVFVLLVDSQRGSVIKVEGDLYKLDFDPNNDVYESSAAWFKNHARVSVSPVDRIWNKLGNANWGDIGALRVLYATFHSIAQFAGVPKNAVEDLAADHSSRLRTRRIDRQLEYNNVNNNNNNGLFMLQHRTASPEIVEVQSIIRVDYSRKPSKLQVGNIILLEDFSNSRDGYRIDEVPNDGEIPYYISSLVEIPRNALFLYVGSHPSHMEPAREDMRLWYQVQRQTKVLSSMRQKGVSSKYLPRMIASGRVVHPGQCRKSVSGSSSNNNNNNSKCDHPWCGTPVLVTSPVGTTVADMARSGQFVPDEAIKCCHDCLSAISASASVGIRHGDIRPENIIRVKKTGMGRHFYVLIGWGHAVLEERDRPAMNLHFSSTSALQEGKLCSASDAESLVYMLYFSSGRELPVMDSVEGALEWRENSWSRRSIQQKLGDISAVLKAFADYVDSLCGTPYPVDYDIWLRRLRRHIPEEDSGKEVDAS